MDLEKKVLDLQVNCPTMSLVGNYKIKGRLLALPITGEGACNITQGNISMIKMLTCFEVIHLL